MPRPTRGLLVILLATGGLIAAGCGGDGDSEAVAQCKQGAADAGLSGEALDAANRICEEAEQLSEDAERGVDEVYDGVTNAVDDVQPDALEQCLEIADQLPEEAEREQARKTCDGALGE